MREEKLERLQEQNKAEVKGVNFSMWWWHQRPPAGPRRLRFICSGDEDQVGDEREESMALNHRGKKVKLGPVKRRAGFVPTVFKIKCHEKTAGLQLD